MTDSASLSSSAATASTRPRVFHSRLPNGLEVVTLPDHRAPVVTHMVWYRNGSADDPRGKSGIAHFLEHLMFKGTEKHPLGQFSNLIAELGGQENAFTSYDYTAYYQRVAKEHLATMMAFEADRMTNLVLTDEVVVPERDVVLEERRMRTDADPSAQLDEATQAALYTHHPYGVPIIGWGHEIEGLTRADALDYYKHFYTPENAILVVAGDIEHEDVERLAIETYGKIPARGATPQRSRTREPVHHAERLVRLTDSKVEQPQFERIFLVPSTQTAAAGESEALEVLAHYLGGGESSLLNKRIVREQKLAVSVGAFYWGAAVDETRFWIYATPAEGVSLDALNSAIDAVLEEVAREGLSETDLVRATSRLVAGAVYAQDSQAAMARWFGGSLAIGMSLESILSWSDRIEAVKADEVAKAAQRLDRRRSVVGYLLPETTP